MAYCSNCGVQLVEGAKFCFECSAKVNLNETQNQTLSHRKVVYEGEIHKCPHCGEVLNSFVSNCTACGYELRGTRSSNSVKEFALNLSHAATYSNKVGLIQNFPIPNTKEDIFEFMILASTNFDTYFSNTTITTKEISAAWISKMEQGYQKAKLLFGDDKEFLKIQNIYDQACYKINTLEQKTKKNSIINLALRTIGLWGGLVIFFVAFLIDIISYSDTSIYHLGGGAIMIIGAFMIGRKSGEIIDVGVGIGCGILSILLGTLLEEAFYGNGSMMELAGGATIIITVVRLVKSTIKK